MKLKRFMEFIVTVNKNKLIEETFLNKVVLSALKLVIVFLFLFFHRSSHCETTVARQRETRHMHTSAVTVYQHPKIYKVACQSFYPPYLESDDSITLK